MSYEYLLGLLNSKLLDSTFNLIAVLFVADTLHITANILKKLQSFPNKADKEKFPLTQKIEEMVKQILIAKRTESYRCRISREN